MLEEIRCKLMRRYVRKKEMINSMEEALGPKIRKSWQKKRRKPIIVFVHMLEIICLKLSVEEKGLLKMWMVEVMVAEMGCNW
jgi:hypothetical protein